MNAGKATAASTVPITTSSTSAGGRRRSADRDRDRAVGHVGDARTAHDDDGEDALQPTTYVVGRRALQHAHPERCRGHVGGAPDHEHQYSGGQHRQSPVVGEAHGDPEPEHGEPPDEDRGDDGEPVPFHPRDPAGEDSAEHRSDRDAGEQQRERHPAALRATEVQVRDLGEQRPWHAEDHRDDVHEERHQQHRVAAESSASPSSTALRPRLPVVPSIGRAGSASTAPRVGIRREGVDQVEPGVAEHRDQGSRDERTPDGAGLHHRHVQRVGGRQEWQRQQSGEYGVPGRLVDREERLLHREQDEQQPHVGAARPGLQPEQGARRDHARRW